MENDILVKQETISPTRAFIDPIITQHWSVSDLKNLGRGIERYGNNNWESIVNDDTLKLHNFSPEALKNKWEHILESVFQSPIAIKSDSEKLVSSTSNSASHVEPEKASRFLYVDASGFKVINIENKITLDKRLARRTAPLRQNNLSNTIVKKNIYTQKPATQTQSTQNDVTQSNVQSISKDALSETEVLENNILDKTSNDSPIISNKNLNVKRKITYSLRPRKLRNFSQGDQLQNSDIQGSSSEESVSESDEDNDSNCYKTETQKTPEPSDASFKGSEAEKSKILSEEDFKSSEASIRITAPKCRRHRQLWSREEEDALRKGVESYGEGQWAVIRADSSLAIHPRRSKVDIKDKWRTICRQVKIKPNPLPQPVARRSRQRWSTDEVKALCEGVNLFGAGHWKKIAEDVRLSGRTTVQLKDKWRNLTFLGFSNEAQYFSVVDENHDVFIKDGVPWEILTQDSQSAALMALSYLLPPCNSSAPKKVIALRILPQFSKQVFVYHGAWASVTPSFPIAQLQCREPLYFKEDDLPSPNFSSTSEKKEHHTNWENNELNTNVDNENDEVNDIHSTIATECNSPYIDKTAVQAENHANILNDNNVANDIPLSDNNKNVNQSNSLNVENESVYETNINLDFDNISQSTKTSQRHHQPYSESGVSLNNHTEYISEIYDLTVDSNDFV